MRSRVARREGIGLGRALVAVCTVAVVLLTSTAQVPQPVLAAPGPLPGYYTVEPGDTLGEIARAFGVADRVLTRVNGIQNPRHLQPGQILFLGPASGAAGEVRPLSWYEDLQGVGRAAGVPLRAIAAANTLVRPTGLRSGIALWVPDGHGATRWAPQDTVSSRAPRLAAAVTLGLPLWTVLRMNPLPTTSGGPVWVPVIGSGLERVGEASSQLPEPLLSLAVSSQPVPRGGTVLVAVQTGLPVTCAVGYLDRLEACVGDADPGSRWLGLAGFPSLLSPGPYTITLNLGLVDGGTVTVPVPIVVSAGRYDYERIDLPPDRQDLLDPALSQRERDLIATLRQRRTRERFWQYPFTRPVDSAITSYYGSRRSYGYGFSSTHAGSDFDGQGGETVLAPADGIVVLAEQLVVRGRAILIDHGWGVVSGFWHLSKIGVDVGDRVVQGQPVGTLGNTGLSTGPHLHWELWVNGTSVDALSWLEPTGPGAVAGVFD